MHALRKQWKRRCDQQARRHHTLSQKSGRYFLNCIVERQFTFFDQCKVEKATNVLLIEAIAICVSE
jgi:hypothetical protein